MKKFDIYLVIGNTKIVLKGAPEYSVTTKATQPQLTAKAPKGGEDHIRDEEIGGGRAWRPIRDLGRSHDP